MPKIVDEKMRETTRRHIIRQAASEFARLGFDQANIEATALMILSLIESYALSARVLGQTKLTIAHQAKHAV